MKFEFDEAKNGNVALTAELDLSQLRNSPSALPSAKASPALYRVCSKAWASLIQSNARCLSINGNRQRMACTPCMKPAGITGGSSSRVTIFC